MKTSWFATLATLGLLPFVWNCSCDEPLQTLQAQYLILDPTASGQSSCSSLDAMPCRFDFGDVKLGSSDIQPILLRNVSNVEIQIAALEIEEEGSADFSVIREAEDEFSQANGVWRLAPSGLQQDRLVMVRFTPQSAGPRRATIKIRSDAGAGISEHIYALSISGAGIIASTEIPTEQPDAPGTEPEPEPDTPPTERAPAEDEAPADAPSTPDASEPEPEPAPTPESPPEPPSSNQETPSPPPSPGRLVVQPTECDFGEVRLGQTSTCDVTLRNAGESPLQVNREGPAGAIFYWSPPFATPSAWPLTLAANQSTVIRLVAQPSSPGLFTNQILFRPENPEATAQSVSLRVHGRGPPVAVAKVASVNGVPLDTNAAENAPTQVRPLDDIVLSGIQSIPASPQTPIVGYRWELVERPAESGVVLSAPQSATTGFSFAGNGSGQYERAGIDVAGRYVVRLKVVDAEGEISTNDMRIFLDAVPGEALHIQMTWDSPANDIDLHLRKGESSGYCGTSDCFYANCKAAYPSHVEWDGVSGFSAGDPVLDVDDLVGYGPENINIDDPADDTYTVGVHFFEGQSPTRVHIKVFAYGALLGTYERRLEARDDFWQVVRIRWANGVAELQSDGSFWEASRCPHLPPDPSSATSPWLCSDTCPFASDGECDDGGHGAQYNICALGSDCSDCGARANPATSPPGGSGNCRNTCTFAYDGECDDGGPHSLYSVCGFGTDCADCGPR